MIPALEAPSGLLPLGRFNVKIEAIKAAYVDDPRWSGSTTRTGIWSEFESATNELRRIVPVAWVWIGGSFLTDKDDPDDIDVVYWCEDQLVDRVTDPQDRQILAIFAYNQVRAQTGLRVDTRYCRWHVDPGADSTPTAEHKAYVSQRGYWDDFWLRKRSGNKGDPAVRADALPSRGYLEVTLDGTHVI